MQFFVVGKSNGGSFEISGGINAIPTERDVVKAKSLNERLHSLLLHFLRNRKDLVRGKEVANWYWHIGAELAKVLSEDVDVGGDALFYRNVRFLMDELNNESDVSYFPADKGSKRNIPEQFVLLSRYPISVVNALKWTNWSNLFDNVTLSQVSLFHKWYASRLQSAHITQGLHRQFIECLNYLIKGKVGKMAVDLSSWEDDELAKLFAGFFDLAISVDVDFNLSKEKKEVKKSLLEAMTLEIVIQLIEGEIRSSDFVDIIRNTMPPLHLNSESNTTISSQ